MKLNTYIIYVCYPNLGLWTAARYVTSTFEEAYALDRSKSERVALDTGTMGWETKAGELDHNGVENFGSWYRERAEDLIAEGRRFPENFDPDKSEFEVVAERLKKFKMPEICPEVHCTQDRRFIDFSKITEDLVKAQFGSLK